MAFETADSIGLDIRFFTGALLVGLFVSTSIYGTNFTMAFQYYTGFPDDNIFYKISVAALLMADTSHFVCGIHMVYFYLVEHYGEPDQLLTIPLSLPILIFFTVFSGSISHINIILKVWTLSNQRKLTAIPLLVIITAYMVLGICIAVTLIIHSSFRQIHDFACEISIGYALLISADVLLCGMLSYLLLKSRSGLPNSRMDTIVNRVVLYLVGIGAVPCVVGILAVVFYWRLPHTLIHTALYVIIERAYVFSFLVLLNSRHLLRRLRGDMDEGTLNKNRRPSIHHSTQTHRLATFTKSMALSENGDVQAPKLERAISKQNDDLNGSE